MMCNMFTGGGFDPSFMGGLGLAWLGIVILFFVCAFARKWIGEGMGMPFNFIASVGLGAISYVILTSITCSYKIGLLVGLVGAVIGGFFLGQFIGDGSE